jgi:hypothetical protein
MNKKKQKNHKPTGEPVPEPTGMPVPSLILIRRSQ